MTIPKVRVCTAARVKLSIETVKEVFENSLFMYSGQGIEPQDLC